MNFSPEALGEDCVTRVHKNLYQSFLGWHCMYHFKSPYKMVFHNSECFMASRRFKIVAVRKKYNKNSILKSVHFLHGFKN